MADRRYTFGAGVSDFVASVSTTGGFLWIRPNQTIQVFADAAGATQLTDLLVGGVDATEITTDANGNVPEFEGPVGYSKLYIGVPGSLSLIVANDLNADIDAATDDAAAALAATVGLDTHEARITANEASVADHGTRLTTAEGEIDVLQADMSSHTHPISEIQATGTPDVTTFLRGDGAWGAPPGGGSGTGSVDSVNGVAPDGTGNVTLTPANIGAASLAVTNDLDATKADLAGPQTHTGTHTFGSINAGASSFTGAVAMGTNKVTGLGTPTASTDAATKGYVDAAAPAASVTSWTPTIGNFTVGNGTVEGLYSVVGKQCTFHLMVTLGSTSAVTGMLTVPLPVAGAAGLTSSTVLGTAVARDVSASVDRIGAAMDQGTGSFNVRFNTPASTTSPHTWGSSDTLSITGTYLTA